jgi:hypothetical protein
MEFIKKYHPTKMAKHSKELITINYVKAFNSY